MKEHAQEDGACIDVVRDVVAEHEGVLGASVDPKAHTVDIHYNPDNISDPQVERLVERMRPSLEKRFEKCTLNLEGRACEACALKLERRVQALDGVRHATATYLGGIMSVTYDNDVIAEEDVATRVQQLGARVSPRPMAWSQRDDAATTWSDRLRALVSEQAFTIYCLLALITAAVAIPLGAPPATRTVALVAAFFFGGWYGVLAGWASLRQLTVDVDLLMVLAAAGAAYIGSPMEGGVLLFLFSFSNVLQDYAIDRARNAIRALIQLRPEIALVKMPDGTLVSRPVDELQLDEVVVVRPGERLPADGLIVSGSSAIDQSTITGESMPVEKSVGETVFAGTINQSGGLEIKVSRLPSDTVIARLIRMVEEAQADKAKAQRFLDQAEQWYAVSVLVFTALVALLPLTWGVDFAASFYKAMIVMVVMSPCALVISTPATILAAIGGAARRGVLFKGGAHLERTSEIKILALDKTGTLTEGHPAVNVVLAAEGTTEETLLSLAASVESRSEHPIAKAVLSEARSRGLSLDAAADFRSITGLGAEANVGGHTIRVGSIGWIESFQVAVSEALQKPVRDAGATTLAVASFTPDGARKLLGVIGVADKIRPDAAEALKAIRKSGIEKIVMLTGDNEFVARAVAEQVGIDEVFANLLPEEKLSIVKRLAEGGPVAMVGDGVNDAPSLAAAHVGIAMGAAGTDVAMETADVVLMSNDLKKIAYAFELSHKARTVVIQNLVFAGSIILLLTAAALGLSLPLPIGVVGHEGSTVLVCLNGLRLLVYRGSYSS